MRSWRAAVQMLAAAAFPLAGEEIALGTATGTLHGTLLIPEGSSEPPVVLIVAGSGPTDRDGNSALLPGRNDSLKMLAEALGERGFASLRYKKRSYSDPSLPLNATLAFVFDRFIDPVPRRRPVRR